MTDTTTLGDLLALQLHLFEEEISDMVDKAVKEMATEKVFFRLLNINNKKNLHKILSKIST